jgi:adenylate cyclase
MADSRQGHGQLLEKLNAYQPRAIGLDIYRDLPVEPGHGSLSKFVKLSPI